MGVSASLFFSSDSEKQTLYRRVTPSDEQFEEQQDRWNELADHMVASLKEKSGYPIRTWLQGSYKFGTQIRPIGKSEEFDIDLGVYFCWEGKPDDGDYEPETLKDYVQASLKNFAESAEGVKEVGSPKPRCCRIRYQNKFHIDVPGYHLAEQKDRRTLATISGWEESDPKAIYKWFKDLFEDGVRARIRRQVKYAKAWSALRFGDDDGRPSSILLTVLIAEAASELDLSKFSADDDLLRELVGKIADRLEFEITVPNPINTEEDIARLSSQQMTALQEAFVAFRDIAIQATSKCTEMAAADVWQEAFGHLFPLPEQKEALTEAARLLPVAVALPEVRVTATSRSNGKTFTGMNGISGIPKNCDIKFEVINPRALPHNCAIYWTVRNEGREAENINDLGHAAGVGLVAEEHSAYKGTHFMDCAVKVNGFTVAIKRVPVTITGIQLPLRNPLRRPEYVKLRGRR